MADSAEIEYMRYEALLDSLRKPEGNKREALDEFVAILGRKNLKPYQDKLVEAATGYFEQSKQYVEGPHVRCAKDLVEDKKISPNTETDNYSPGTTVAIFERIIVSPNAHDQVRSLLLNRILEARQFMDQTIDFVEETVFAEELDRNQAEFITKARELVFKSVDDSIGSKLEPDSTPDKLRKFVLDKFVTNQLSEAEMWKLFRSLIKESPDYAKELLAISKLEGADTKLRELASEEVIKLESYRVS